MLGLTDPLNPAEDRTFGYDAINRLTSAQGRWGSGTMTYDAFGNLSSLNLGANTERYAYNGQRLRTVFHNEATSSWYNHDVYGNLRQDVEVLGLNSTDPQNGGQQYSYDDAGRLRSVLKVERTGGIFSNSLYYFDYDGQGQQLRRSGPAGELTHFVHGRMGQLLGEYPGSPQYGKEYVYLGSQLLRAPAPTNLPRPRPGRTGASTAGVRTTRWPGRNGSDPDGAIVRYAWAQSAAAKSTVEKSRRWDKVVAVVHVTTRNLVCAGRGLAD